MFNNQFDALPYGSARKECQGILEHTKAFLTGHLNTTEQQRHRAKSDSVKEAIERYDHAIHGVSAQVLARMRQARQEILHEVETVSFEDSPSEKDLKALIHRHLESISALKKDLQDGGRPTQTRSTGRPSRAS